MALIMLTLNYSWSMTSVCYIIIHYEYMQAALFPLLGGLNVCMCVSMCIRPPPPLNNFNRATPTTYSLPEQMELNGGHLKHIFCSLKPLVSCSTTAILLHFSMNCLPSRLYFLWYHHRVLQRSIVPSTGSTFLQCPARGMLRFLLST